MQINLSEAYNRAGYRDNWTDFKQLNLRQKVITVATVAFLDLATNSALNLLWGSLDISTVIVSTAVPLSFFAYKHLIGTLANTAFLKRLGLKISMDRTTAPLLNAIIYTANAIIYTAMAFIPGIGPGDCLTLGSRMYKDPTIAPSLIMTALTAAAVFSFTSPIQIAILFWGRIPFAVRFVLPLLITVKEILRNQTIITPEFKNKTHQLHAIEAQTKEMSPHSLGDLSVLPPDIIISILIQAHKDAKALAEVNRDFNKLLNSDAFQNKFKMEICPANFGREKWKKYWKTDPGIEPAIPRRLIARYDSSIHILTFVPKKITLPSGDVVPLTISQIIELASGNRGLTVAPTNPPHLNANLLNANLLGMPASRKAHWFMLSKEPVRTPPRRNDTNEDQYNSALREYKLDPHRPLPDYDDIDCVPTNDLSVYFEEMGGEFPEIHDSLVAIFGEAAQEGSSSFKKALTDRALQGDEQPQQGGGLRVRLAYPLWGQKSLSWDPSGVILIDWTETWRHKIVTAMSWT